MIAASLGNMELLKLHKTAFLCSRKIPASVVLKCYDWAIAQREQGNCVISCFHSKIEKDVFHYLLAGTQPIIMALARGMKKNIEPELKIAIDSGRLLLITPFDHSEKRISAETADIRNRFMIDLADEVVIGYAGKGGMTKKEFEECHVLFQQEDKSTYINKNAYESPECLNNIALLQGINPV